jgi:hypothetical protein
MLAAALAETPLGSVWALNDGSGLNFPVKVLDLRKRWDMIDAQVTPVGGAGTRWVQTDKLGRVESLRFEVEK